MKEYNIEGLAHNPKAKSFFESIKGKRVAICGIGVNNTPVALQFRAFGAKVTACDRREREVLGETAELLEAAGVRLCLGESYLSSLKEVGADLILRTPGMKPHLPEFNEARECGIAVTSEMELFFSLCPAPITAVTGSDGKTTTTSIIAGLLERAGHTVHLGGNIGRSLLPIIDEITAEHQVVAEISSFQLMLMTQSPNVAVITNISPNHLDWHRDMAEYIEAKRNLILWQKAGDTAVLNGDDPTLREFIKDCKTDNPPFIFSRRKVPKAPCAYADENGDLYLNSGERAEFIMNSSEIFLKGVHNVENYLAAFCAVSGKVSAADMAGFAREFTGVAHRCEYVRTLDGVMWYNDSMASSPSRTLAGLRAFGKPVVYIGGGYDKNIPYDNLGEAAGDYMKIAILFGATADKIEAAIRACSDIEIVRAKTLEEVVETAKRVAREGDIVFFSPASASFDMFKNFEERGNRFKELVRAL